MLKIYVKYLSKSIGPFFFEGSCCTSFGFSWFVIGRPPKAPVDISLSETGVQRHEKEMNETNETEHPNCSLDPNKGELCLTTTSGCFFLNRTAWKKRAEIMYIYGRLTTLRFIVRWKIFWREALFFVVVNVFSLLWVWNCWMPLNTYGCVDSLKLSMVETKTTWWSKDIAWIMVGFL